MSDDFYKRLDAKEQEGRLARIFKNRPDNLHDYQGCANDPSMQPIAAPALPAVDKSEGVNTNAFAVTDPSPLPVNEKFTLWLDEDGDYMLQSQRETGLQAHADNPESAVYVMRQVLDMASSLVPAGAVEQRGETPRCDNCGELGNHRTDEGAGNWGSDGPPGFILEKNPTLTYSCKTAPPDDKDAIIGQLPTKERIERTVKCTVCGWYTAGVPQQENWALHTEISQQAETIRQMTELLRETLTQQ
jgi:hypothetical protein